MNESLQTFYRWFWISIGMSAMFGFLLFVVTRRREAWLRYIAAETAFWIRLGFPPRRLVEAVRRFEESYAFIYALWFIVIAFVALTLLSGASYLRFKDRWHKGSPNQRVDRTAAPLWCFVTCREGSESYSCSVAALPAAVGHSKRWLQWESA